MSAITRRFPGTYARRAAGGYGRVPHRFASTAAADAKTGDNALKKGARKDPELYVCCFHVYPGLRD
jgi:hypothetical protein